MTEPGYPRASRSPAIWPSGRPHDVDGPTVSINVDSPILQEVVHYHQAQYPDIFAEEVAKTVRQVFGEVAACKRGRSATACCTEIRRDELT
jgi:hypothetical protein